MFGVSCGIVFGLLLIWFIHYVLPNSEKTKYTEQDDTKDLQEINTRMRHDWYMARTKHDKKDV